MRKLYIVGLVAVAALVIGIAIADEIKFSTFYPSPSGKYRNFDTTGRTLLATDEWGIEGDNARVGIGTTDPTQQLEITKSFRLPVTTDSSTGVIYKGDARFIHNYEASGNNGYNTFVGIEAGNFTMASSSASQASYNIAVGYRTLYDNTTGFANTVMGHRALCDNTTGYQNSAMGFEALRFNTTGYRNSATGWRALRLNTTGYTNCAMGHAALYGNTAGYRNSAMGYRALYGNTTGRSNSALGYQAGLAISTGNYNTFLGCYAGATGGFGFQKADAVNSMALGYNTYTTADNQVVIGNSSVTETLLRGNVSIGVVNPTAHLSIESGNNDTQLWIDNNHTGHGLYVYQAGISAAGNHGLYVRSAQAQTASPLVRFNQYNNAANQYVLSIHNNGSAYDIYDEEHGAYLHNGTWQDGSDIAFKKDIEDLKYGLNELLRMQPRKFKLKVNDVEQIGFVAQELEQIIPEVVSGEEGKKGVAYGHLTAVTVKAVQELKAENDTLKARIEALEAKFR